MRRSLASTGLLAISGIVVCVAGSSAAAQSIEASTPQSFEKLSGIHFGLRPGKGGISTSFIENIIPALSMAVDLGVEGAAEA